MTQEEFDKRIAFLYQLQKQYPLAESEITKAVDDAIQQRNAGVRSEVAAIKELNTALEKQASLSKEIANAAIEAQLKTVQGDSSLTDKEKAQQSIGLWQQQIGASADEQTSLQRQYDSTSDLTAQLEIRKRITDQTVVQAELESKIQKSQDQYSFGGQLVEQFTKLQSQTENLGKDLASVVMSPFQGMKAGLDSAFTQMMEHGTNLKKFMDTVGLSIEKSFVKSAANMAADWLTNSALMLVRWIATQTGMTSILALHTATRTAVHATGEATQTAATSQNSVMRQGINLVETVAHMLGTAIKVAVHIAGEVAMTAVTLVESAMRLAPILVECVAYVIKAAVSAMSAMAQIPYIGPILAVAAAAAMIGTGMALVAKAFAEGGRPDPGKPAIVGEKGWELFVPDTAGTIIPHNTAAAMLSGNGGSSQRERSGANSQKGPTIHNVIVYDHQQLMNELKSSQAEHIVVTHVYKNRLRCGIGT
jgi:hypothetical protein